MNGVWFGRLPAAAIAAALAAAEALGRALHGSAFGTGDVDGTHLARARVLLDVKLHLLAVSEGLVAVAGDSGEVDEIVLAVSAGNESEPLGGVEELDGSGVRHDCLVCFG